MSKFCVRCGTQLDDSQEFCPNCGDTKNAAGSYSISVHGGKSRIIAGILGLLLGGLGVHNFYLGNTGRGIAQIIVSIFTVIGGSIWGIVEGILILTGTINTDADGNPLID